MRFILLLFFYEQICIPDSVNIYSHRIYQEFVVSFYGFATWERSFKIGDAKSDKSGVSEDAPR